MANKGVQALCPFELIRKRDFEIVMILCLRRFLAFFWEERARIRKGKGRKRERRERKEDGERGKEDEEEEKEEEKEEEEEEEEEKKVQGGRAWARARISPGDVPWNNKDKNAAGKDSEISLAPSPAWTLRYVTSECRLVTA
uniref:Uncharacterized protein n=1 Tax=Vespula pensylvanica TaxID=30213 RepID=A0A834NWV9_VESPE|nr:hypothetical protein H0235_010312 [Vespula pensylvanica]